MEFRDLKAQYRALKADIDKAIAQVLDSCHFITGEQVGNLEQELAEYVGVKHCITCANGTDALTMAMMAWDIGEGDVVFVPDFTFFSSGEIVSRAGATPVFVDVDANTFNISVENLEAQIKKVLDEGILKPRAIIGVDLFGLPADFVNLRKIADKYSLQILEDGAQGFGGEINGKRACSFGDISTTSFFPAKPLGCYGDGGAIFTNDGETADLLRSIGIHGKGNMKYDNVRIGLNSRLDTLQAAILSVKLRAFKTYELENINRIAESYTKALKDIVKTPYIPNGFYSSWAQYTIKLGAEGLREKLQGKLREKGIPTAIYYPKPMHRQQAFHEKSFDDQDFRTTSELCKTVLSLPMHPYLTDEDIDRVVDALNQEL